MSIPVTFYLRPNGRQDTRDIENISPEAEKYILENNVNVSMEDCGALGYVIYLDDGTPLHDYDDTPDEIIVLARGRPCEECIDEGVEKLKARKSG